MVYQKYFGYFLRFFHLVTRRVTPIADNTYMGMRDNTKGKDMRKIELLIAKDSHGNTLEIFTPNYIGKTEKELVIEAFSLAAQHQGYVITKYRKK